MDHQTFIISNKKEWDAYVAKSLIHEVFHTWYYHSLNKSGEPLLFVYEEGDLFIALPVIKRKIENTSLFDMTSVYGYSGPISNIDLSDLPALTIEHFKNAFVNFMKEEKVVCIFSRLHPFLNQHSLLNNFGGLRENGTTLYMDLSLSIEDQRNKYEKRLSRQIRKLREKGYVIMDDNSVEGIKNFTDMYWKNMDRVSASSHYYFDEQYFANLLNMEGFENKLILIYNGEELICGALLLLSDNIIRNHLSATSPEYLKESPSKLLTDEISVIGRRLGKKIFHLGGGVSGKEDSLFTFKRYFSDLRVKDYIWCYINDDLVYNDLVLKAGAKVDDESFFFPLYRQAKRQTEPHASNIETPTI
jgi:hypothetical protein